MRTIKTLLVVLFAGITFQGCITSLHPLYTDKDLVFDKRLLGAWRSDSPTESLKLENLMEKQLSPYKDEKERKDKEMFKSQFINKKTYLLTYTDKGEAAEFLLNLVKLDNNFYIDLYPRGLKEKNEMLEDHYLPVHSYAKINIDDNGCELSYLNADLLYKLLNENRIKIRHESFEL